MAKLNTQKLNFHLQHLKLLALKGFAFLLKYHSSIDHFAPKFIQTGLKISIYYLCRFMVFQKTIGWISRANWKAKINTQYQTWIQQHQLSPEKIQEMKSSINKFEYRPLISILTPVYNVKEDWLRKAINSVRNQIYQNWELCLVNDGSTLPHVEKVLNEYSGLDQRIKVVHEARNLGIVGASERALHISTGEFIGLLDHDDELSTDALYQILLCLNTNLKLDLIYSDEDKIDTEGQRSDPFFKPDWSPDLLLSMNYITHFCVIRKTTLEASGGFRSGFDGSQDYDLILRVTERTDNIAHIPKILYHWRKIPGSAASSETAKPYAYVAGQKALLQTLNRKNCKGRVDILSPGLYMIRYQLPEIPLVSIIVFIERKEADLISWLNSIAQKLKGCSVEMIFVSQAISSSLLEALSENLSLKHSVCFAPQGMNIPSLYNFGASKANGSFFLFLDNHLMGINSEWMDIMVEQGSRNGVGAVGTKILSPSGQIHHGGILLGVNGLIGYAFKGIFDRGGQHFGFTKCIRNCTALSGKCLMISRVAFQRVNGFDDQFTKSLYDIDLCLKLQRQAFRNIWIPFPLLHESPDLKSKEVIQKDDEKHFREKWKKVLGNGDPYYNPNLSILSEDFTLRV